MPITPNYAKLNLIYLCKKNSLNINELQKTLNVKLSLITIIALIKICNYFQIDMDLFVLSDLQKIDEEI